jgi:hypothetical protein
LSRFFLICTVASNAKALSLIDASRRRESRRAKQQQQQQQACIRSSGIIIITVDGLASFVVRMPQIGCYLVFASSPHTATRKPTEVEFTKVRNCHLSTPPPSHFLRFSVRLVNNKTARSSDSWQ